MATMTNPGRPQAAPRKRRSRTWRRLVIALAIVVGLLVAADFAAAAVFEHQVSKKARTQLNLADDPSVKVGGFSFLLQAISGEYSHITVDAKGVPVQDLRDVEVHADLLNVTAPLGDLMSGSTKGIKVGEVDGQVTVKASDIARALQKNENQLLKSITRVIIDPVTKKFATTKPSGNTSSDSDPADPEGTSAGARICATADIIGQSTDLCAYGIITMTGSSINFDPKRVDIRNGLTSGSLPVNISDQVRDYFAFKMNPGNLPFTVTPTAVKVDPGMVTLKGKAMNVTVGGTSR
jgi:hypothetical protein